MVIIDTVYQKVLAIANKEQRGYITPQEFNLFANQAQMDIFGQYFYDLNQFSRIPNAGIEYSDVNEKIDEKLSIFKDMSNPTGSIVTIGGLSAAEFSFPIVAQSSLYKIGTIQGGTNNVEIHKVDYRELAHIINSPLTAPTLKRPIYVLGNEVVNVFPDTVASILLHFVRTPILVAWGYTVVNEKPMYNFGNTVNFELHVSEETNLVFKILQLAGITIKDPTLYQIAAQEETKSIQQEKQ